MSNKEQPLYWLWDYMPCEYVCAWCGDILGQSGSYSAVSFALANINYSNIVIFATVSHGGSPNCGVELWKSMGE
jgi:hypothetical protein